MNALYLLKKFCKLINEDGINTAMDISKQYLSKRYRQLSGELSTKLSVLYYKSKYGNASPDPSRLVYIHPKEVNWLISPRFIKPMYQRVNIVGGKWDINYTDDIIYYTDNGHNTENNSNHKLIPFKNFVFYSSLKKHFIEGYSWEETEIFEYFLDNNISSYYTTRSAILDRLNELDILYQQIKEYGYLTQQEMKSDAPLSSGTSTKYPELHEVLIHIGRDGTLIFCTGRHRFSIAKILGIKIPVKVHVRHKQWQGIRNEVGNANSLDELSETAKSQLDHPDLVDVKEYNSLFNKPTQ